MTTISPFSLSLPYRTENRRFSTLSCTKTGSTQPKLSAACFVVQSCLADADFVVSSNYCLIGTRQKGCFFFALPRGSGCFPRRARRENAACAPQHQGGIFSFRRKRISPLIPPKRKGFDWQPRARMTFVPPEWKCLRAAKPRLPLLYDSGYSYYPLPLCPSCRSAQ